MWLLRAQVYDATGKRVDPGQQLQTGSNVPCWAAVWLHLGLSFRRTLPSDERVINSAAIYFYYLLANKLERRHSTR